MGVKEHTSDVDGNEDDEDEKLRKIKKISTWCKEDRLNFYSAVSYVSSKLVKKRAYFCIFFYIIIWSKKSFDLAAYSSVSYVR